MTSGVQSNLCGARVSVALEEFRRAHVELLERLQSERGATMTEYGLLLAFVAVIVFGGVALFGPAVVDLFTDTNDEFSTYRSGGPTP